MSESRPLASLSSSLLARKGHAKPAMRPQAIVLGQTYGQSLEDLGWNDMGHEHDHDALPMAEVISIMPASDAPIPDDAPMPYADEAVQATPAANVVEEQRELLVRQFVAPVSPVVSVAVRAPKPAGPPLVRAMAGSKGRAAFTLRLDGERHLKLRMVCAVQHRSAQQIVTQALDEFLARQPDIAELAAKARN